MEIHQLEYLVAVAEESHFSRAAERVGVAQPSLSQQIKKLEQEVGQPLFDRMARGIVLTEAGRVLLEHARRVLGEIADAKKHVAESSGNVGGTLVVGAIPTIAPYLLPDVLTRFSKRWPNVKLRVFEGPTSQMVRQLEDGSVDVAILSTLEPHLSIFTEEIAVEPLVLLLPAGHKFAKRKTIQWKDLQDEGFLTLNEVNCLSGQVAAYCEQRKVQPPFFMESAQLATIAELVSSGAGISVVPRMMAAKDACKSRVYRPLAAPAPERVINIATPALRYRTQALRHFVDLVKVVIGKKT